MVILQRKYSERETVCPLKVYLPIRPLAARRNCAREYGKEIGRVKRKLNYIGVKQKKGGVYMGKENIYGDWGSDVISICIIYWSDIHVWAPGNYYILFATKN